MSTVRMIDEARRFSEAPHSKRREEKQKLEEKQEESRRHIVKPVVRIEKRKQLKTKLPTKAIRRVL
jgi:hypothetical protein